MNLKPTKVVRGIMDKRFEELLKTDPHLASVNYKEYDGCISFDLVEYAVAWGKFAKLVHGYVMEIDPLGIFSRKSNEGFVSRLKLIVSQIDGEMVVNAKDRYKTPFDN